MDKIKSKSDFLFRKGLRRLSHNQKYAIFITSFVGVFIMALYPAHISPIIDPGHYSEYFVITYHLYNESI